ncbi:hypothetical protein M0805_005500 [Coniferiporia weirii]|nr:hypothetical protein M0805_005500 [Coniferiporia weirii]
MDSSSTAGPSPPPRPTTHHMGHRRRAPSTHDYDPSSSSSSAPLSSWQVYAVSTQHFQSSSSLCAPMPQHAMTSIPVPVAHPHPHVALRAATPQGTVSPELPSAGVSDVGTADTDASARKKAIDRNRRPCGNCSSSKRKCKIVSTSPHLCERCRNHGLTECPPHISWAMRKASMCDSGSLSPLDTDERALSSRSVSPLHITSSGPGRSPTEFPAQLKSEADAYATQAWVQTQAAAEPEQCAPYFAPRAPAQEHLRYPDARYAREAAKYVLFLFEEMDDGVDKLFLCSFRSASFAAPACHVCGTPYLDELLLSYALAVAAAASAPASTSPYGEPHYDHDALTSSGYALGHGPANTNMSMTPGVYGSSY